MAKDELLIVGRHYPAIDGLRGIAVLLVLWSHAAYFAYEMNSVGMSGAAFLYYKFSQLGISGVDLFFVLSGFLITGILIDTRNDKHNFKSFYIRRALRIFPLYYAVSFVFIIIVLCFSELNIGKIVAHLFYLQNFFGHNFDNFMVLNHTWSLAVEEQFYIFWPFVFLAVYKRSFKFAIALCVCLILFSWVGRFLISNQGYEKVAYTYTLFRLDTLCLGALLSIISVKYKDYLMKRQYLFVCGSIFSVGVLYLLFLFCDYGGETFSLLITVGFSVISLFYVCLLGSVFYIKEGSGSSLPVIGSKPMRFIGRISYGLYLFHVPVMLLVGMFLVRFHYSYWVNHLLLLIGGGLLSLVAASLSYNYFENRFLHLKKKYAPLKPE